VRNMYSHSKHKHGAILFFLGTSTCFGWREEKRGWRGKRKMDTLFDARVGEIESSF